MQQGRGSGRRRRRKKSREAKTETQQNGRATAPDSAETRGSVHDLLEDIARSMRRIAEGGREGCLVSTLEKLNRVIDVMRPPETGAGHFALLPTEILHAIAREMDDVHDLGRFAVSSRFLYDALSGEDVLWRPHYDRLTTDSFPYEVEPSAYEFVATNAIAGRGLSRWFWLIGARHAVAGAASRKGDGCLDRCRILDGQKIESVRYTGERQAGDAHGWGVMSWKVPGGTQRNCWSVHAGHFASGKPVGLGWRFLRHWNGKVDAPGTNYLAYRGTWSADNRFKGQVRSDKGSDYDGEMRDGQKHGTGLATERNGPERPATWPVKILGDWQCGELTDSKAVYRADGGVYARDRNNGIPITKHPEGMWMLGKWGCTWLQPFDRFVVLPDRCLVIVDVLEVDKKTPNIVRTFYTNGDVMEGRWTGAIDNPRSWSLQEVRWFVFSASCPEERFGTAAIVDASWHVGTQHAAPSLDPRYEPTEEHPADRELFLAYVAAGHIGWGQKMG